MTDAEVIDCLEELSKDVVGEDSCALMAAVVAIETLAKVRLKLDVATKTTWRHCNDPTLDGLLDDLNRLVKP